jgi:hypothetical protein
VYDAKQYVIEDKWLDRRFSWNGNFIDERVAEAMEESLRQATHAMLED